MITKRQKFSLIFFLTSSFFLASGYSLIFKISEKDSWISMIIGTLIGLLILLIFNIFSFNKKRKYILNKDLKIFYKVMMIVFFSFILFINILIVRIFTTSFLLTKTPGIIITIPFILLAYKNSKHGINSIAKIAEILLPISIIIILLTIIAVLKDGSINSFFPLLTVSKNKILTSSIYYAIFTSVPNLLLFDTKIDLKTHIKSYLFSSLIISLIGVFIIYTLGPYLIKIFRFPEYMVLKQLKVFNFIEKIENLIGLIWIFNLFISASLSLYNIDKVSNSNILNLLIIGIIIYIIEFISNNYEYAMVIYKNLPIILFIIGLIFSLIIFKLKHKKSS